MPHSVKVRQLPRPLSVADGQTILDAALAQGFDYPCGCQSGNCGACKSRLLSGRVEHAPFSEFALMEEEKAAGLILACRAMPLGDCEVAWVEADDTAMHPRREMTCRVVGIEDATHDIKIVRLAIETGGPFVFSAGQYAALAFGSLPARDFSMANRPDEAVLEFHIRLVPGGAVSSFVATRLKVGDKVKASGPLGISYWREKHTGPIYALAGGSGLAPIKSIVETALKAGKMQPIRLYFGVRGERDVYLEKHFAALAAKHRNLTFIPVLSQPDGATARRTGNMADAVAKDVGSLDGAKVYIAGPPIMVETTVKALEPKGLKREHCHVDSFYTAADRPK